MRHSWTVLFPWQTHHTSVTHCCIVVNFYLTNLSVRQCHLQMFTEINLTLCFSLPGQPVYHDNPAVQDLLHSLPLPALILQCLQLEPATTSPHLSPLLSQLSLQQWQDSTSATEGDQFGLVCAVRMLLAVLHKLYSAESVCKYYAQTADSHHPQMVLCKAWIKALHSPSESY